MSTTILVAGSAGNLGVRINDALIERGANVRAIVRAESDKEKIEKLEQRGVEVIKINRWSTDELTNACNGVSCVVSALQGLRDVIVDAQTTLLDAAVAAGVSRFIPSDYSLDFIKLTYGTNRNFDLRRDFHNVLDKASIAATSVFNGAFAEILSYNVPMLDYKKRIVGYWGDDSNFKMDYTTMDDTAAFTASAALDTNTPRYLRIASFQVSPNDLLTLASDITKTEYKLAPMGSVDDFAAQIKEQRAAHPEGENELNPRWQSGQYMHDQFSVQHESLDNNRYDGIDWTSAKEFLNWILSRK